MVCVGPHRLNRRGMKTVLPLFDRLIDCIITYADVKNPARDHKVEKHHSEGKNVRRRTFHTKRKRKWYKKILRKGDISK